jgi:hypothetical protein
MASDLYHAAVLADQVWHNAIVQAFPREWPGNVRYTKRGEGEPGTPLRAAFESWKLARDAWRAECLAKSSPSSPALAAN